MSASRVSKQSVALLAVALVCGCAPSLLGPLPGALTRTLQSFGLYADWAYVWPASAACAGLLFAVAHSGGRRGAMTSVPASVATAIGGVLALVTAFGMPGGWAYAWTLVPAAVGFGIAATGLWNGRPEATRTGGYLMYVGGALFTAFGVSFELVSGLAGLSGRTVGPLLVPILAIGVGVLVLGRNLQRTPVRGR